MENCSTAVDIVDTSIVISGNEALSSAGHRILLRLL